MENIFHTFMDSFQETCEVAWWVEIDCNVFCPISPSADSHFDSLQHVLFVFQLQLFVSVFLCYFKIYGSRSSLPDLIWASSPRQAFLLYHEPHFKRSWLCIVVTLYVLFPFLFLARSGAGLGNMELEDIVSRFGLEKFVNVLWMALESIIGTCDIS
jgi:hypothetical protein